MKEKNRIVAILLAIMMVVTYMPSMAFAAAGDETEPAVGVEAQEETVADDAQDEPAEAEAPAEEPEAEAQTEESDAQEAAPEAAEETEPAAGKAAPAGLVSASPVNMTPDADIADNDELLGQYFDAEVDKALGKKASDGKLRAARTSRRSMLNSMEQDIYDAILALMQDVASGNESRAVVSINLRDQLDAYLVDTGYEDYPLAITADSLELQYSDVYIDTGMLDDNGNPIWGLSYEAKAKLFDIDRVIDAVLIDQPYYSYWFDKVTGYIPDFNALYDTSNGEGSDAYFEGDPVLELSFTVAGAYRAEDSEDGFDINTGMAASTAVAVEKVERIIAENGGEGDLDKLYAYKDAICELTSYNDSAAAGNYEYEYGDPWQLIWVFDGDDTTNVVCEGYAKAFQFLCDKSPFISSKIECRTVSGTMSGQDATGAGPHMWNILHMDDGKNYIADLTNCDADTVGYPDQLFLKGCSSGDTKYGYDYTCNDGESVIHYAYDDEVQNLYYISQLEMSDADYGESDPDRVPVSISWNRSDWTVYGVIGTSIIEGSQMGSEGDTLTVVYSNGDEELYTDRILELANGDRFEGYYPDDATSEEDDLLNIPGFSLEVLNESSVLEEGDNTAVLVFDFDGTLVRTQEFTITGVETIPGEDPYSGDDREVEEITFTPINGPLQLLENRDGSMVTGENGEEYFQYDFPYWPNFNDGDELTIKFADADEPLTYTYYGWDDEVGEQVFARQEEDGWDKIDAYDLTYYSNQSGSWEPGGEGYLFYIGYNGKYAEYPVEIMPNRVKAVAFERDGGVSFVEGVDGVNSDGGDNSFFEYYLRFKEGDKLTLTVQDEGQQETTEEYVYAEETEGSGDQVFRFVRLENGELNFEECLNDDELWAEAEEQSYENEWKYNDGKDHWVKVVYMGVRSEEIPVTMLQNPVISFVFERSGGVTLMEGVDGTYYEDVGETVFEYELVFKPGDLMIVTYLNETVPRYYEAVADEDGLWVSRFVRKKAGEFIDDDFIDVSDIDMTSQPRQWVDHWSPYDGMDHTFELYYSGKSFTLPVTLVENSGVVDINNCEVSFDEEYLQERDIETTPYLDQFYVVHAGTVLDPIVKNGDDFVDSDYYMARYLEQEFDPDAENGEGAWGPKEDAEWSEEFPTEGGVYFCEVSGVGQYTGTYEGMLPLVYVEDHEWNDGEVTIPATETEAGEMTFTCTVCGATRTEEIPPEGSELQSFSFEPAELTFTENTHGEMTTETIEDPTGSVEDVEYFRYQFSIYTKGYKLIINGDTYTYGPSPFEDEDGDWEFYNEDGEVFYPGEEGVEWWDDQSYNNQWSPDHPGTITIEYKGATCEIPVTITENPVSNIEFIPAEPAEFVEYNGGWMTDDYIWNDETEEEEYVTYYKYDTYDIVYNTGSKIIVNGEDEYTYGRVNKKYGFYNSDGEALGEDDLYVDDNQSYEYQWSVNNQGTLTVTYLGQSCTIPVTILENPVTGITFTPVHDHVDLIENVDGSDEEDDHFYYWWRKYEEGDQLTVHYSDRDDATYIYKASYDQFVNTENKKDIIEIDYEEGGSGLSYSADQREQWTVGNEYEMYVTYQRQTTLAKKIRIVPNPVESVAFSRNGESRIELIERKDIDDDYEWEGEERYDRYKLAFQLGDLLTVKNVDGTTAVYEYRTVNFGRYDEDVFVNIEDDTDILNTDNDRLGIYAEPEQSAENEWTANGGPYNANVEYCGKIAEVEVEVLPNPITDVKYKPGGKDNNIQLVENMNGWVDWDYNEDDERIEYFYYNFPDFRLGDRLEVIQNGTDMYTYELRDGVRVGDHYELGFVNITDKTDVITTGEVELWDSNQGINNQWVVGGTGYTFTFKYYGVEFDIPVEIIKNPVSAFDFSRDGYEEGEAIELTEGLDARINSDGGKNRWFEYFLTFKNGDTITVTDPDEKTSDYNAVPYKNWDEAKWFENDEGKKIELYDIEQSSDQSWNNQWLPEDGTHTILLDYYTRQTEVNVKIKENPVKSFSFNRPGNDGAPIELLKNGDGSWGDETFYYEIDFKAGDELDVTYTGISDPVKYVAQAAADGKVHKFVAEGSVPPGAEAEISRDELYCRHNTSRKLFEDEFGETDEGEIMLMYMGKWTDVPVKLVENPVESIEFVWKDGGDRVELVENQDGYEVDIEVDEIEDFFRYNLNFKEGDILKVKYAGTSDPVSYVYSIVEDYGLFKATGTVPAGKPSVISAEDVYRYSEQYYFEPWTVGNDYEFELEYLGSKFTVPVIIVEGEEPGECDHTYVFVAAEPATCIASGMEEHYRCSECGKLFVKSGEDYVETAAEDLAIPATGQHTPGEAVHENEVAPTCSTAGSYDEVVYCTVCHTEISRQKKEISATGNHIAGDPVRENEVAATCDKPGSYDEVIYCKNCNHEISRETKAIPATGKHTAGEPVRENEVAATCAAAGHYDEVTYCTVCKKEISRQTKEIPAGGNHTAGAPIHENEVAATCKAEGHYDEVVYCTVCKKELSRKTVTVPYEPTPEEKALEEALNQANAQTDDASGKADAAENSTDENVVSEAENAAAQAAELAAEAEAAAEQAFDKAEAAYQKAVNSGDAAQIETAKENLDVATANLATAKKIKAAATSAVAKSKKAAASIASKKAAEASAAAAKASTPAAAEELRKEAEAQAAIAAEKAAAAENASAAASQAAADLEKVADKIDDPAVKEEIKKEAEAAKESADKASESAQAAETSSGEAQASETKAEEAVQEAKRKGVYDSKMPKMSIKSKSSKKTSITIKWSKLSTKNRKKCTKIEIWLCPNTKFAKADTKIKTVSKTATSVTFKSLKKNKKYYFKIRTIKYVNGVKHVGKWSTRKYIKTKKK